MGKSRRIAGLPAILFGLLATVSTAVASECDPEKIDIRGPFGQLRFSVEIADDRAEQQQGLMFRESLPTFSGMLFVYETPTHAAFWMKNTLIPLDMVFIDETGTVSRIHSEAVPGDLTSIPSGTPVLAVLEVGGGLAEKFNIAVGAEVRHPAFDNKSAVWPCS